MKDIEVLRTLDAIQASLYQAIEPVFKNWGLELNNIATRFFNEFQLTRQGLCVCFEATTHNRNFFGLPYDNNRRIQLLNAVYEAAGQTVATAFPKIQFCLDYYVHLIEPYFVHDPVTLTSGEGHSDVTTDNDVTFENFAKLVKQGTIQRGSSFWRYCKKYGLKDVLRHHHPYISPDTSTVECFEAICNSMPISSVLEIGAGVGICGEAAYRFGSADFTFVDSSPKVCEYLRQKFDWTEVIQANAFDFKFKRDYDLILIGLPYELLPSFLSRNGSYFARHSEIVVFQSGTPLHFQFEHDWIFGKQNLRQWPWWHCNQTVPKYWNHNIEAVWGWQNCIVSGNQDLRNVLKTLRKRGFEIMDYEIT